MTDPKDRLEEDLEKLRRDTAAMERPDRAIPVPRNDEEDDGVGPVTGAVP
ncbi:hypothetical protein [Brevundimonas sp. FT23042]